MRRCVLVFVVCAKYSHSWNVSIPLCRLVIYKYFFFVVAAVGGGNGAAECESVMMMVPVYCVCWLVRHSNIVFLFDVVTFYMYYPWLGRCPHMAVRT